MAAYIVVDIDVHDSPGLEEYRRLVPATVARYGGRFLARGPGAARVRSRLRRPGERLQRADDHRGMGPRGFLGGPTGRARHRGALPAGLGPGNRPGAPGV